jgi:hypothetical protein
MKLQLISPESYCPTRKVPFDKQEIIQQIVKKEDLINHPFVPMKAPKLVLAKNMKPTYAFFKEIKSIMTP